MKLEYSPKYGHVIVGAGFTLRLPRPTTTDEANKIASMLAAFERTKRGGFLEMLKALSGARHARGEEAGATAVTLYEGAGDLDVRPSDWQESSEVAQTKKHKRAG